MAPAGHYASHRPGPKTTLKRRSRKAAASLAALRRWKEASSPMQPPSASSASQAPTVKKISGTRIIDMEKLSADIARVSHHSSICTGVCHVVEEVRREGLVSVFLIECDKCREKFRCESSNKVNGSSSKKKRYVVNLGAVWGQMVTGGGPSKLNEIAATLDMPGMHRKTFVSIEKQIGQAWETLLAEEMTKAGEEERQLAIQKKESFEGVPAITVTVDAGWSKRSHKHSYNAKSGVAVIIGNATKKLLFLAVRNKYCAICAVAENKGVSPKEHKCYRNWGGSSCGMESDMIVEGFRAAETMHKVRYMKMVGDGDSSVHANIQTNVLGWGVHVAKIECANHSVKCYRNRLEKIVQDFPQYKGKGKLTGTAIKRLTNGARCAIKINSKDGNVDQLRKDLRNCPNHVFNDHSNCSTYFCKVAAARAPNSAETQSVSPAVQPQSYSSVSTPQSPTAQTPPQSSSAQTPPQSSSAQTPPQLSSAQTPPQLSSAQTPPQLSSAQTPPQPSSAQTPPQLSSPHTPPQSCSAQTPPQSSSVHTQSAQTTPQSSSVQTSPHSSFAQTPPWSSFAQTPAQLSGALTPPQSYSTCSLLTLPPFPSPSPSPNSHSSNSARSTQLDSPASPQSLPLDSPSHSATSDPDSLSDMIDRIIDDEEELYSAEEEARDGDSTADVIHLSDDLYFRIQRAGDRLVSNAVSLISNSTSNLAECFMGIRCKFDGGKVFNRIQRGSFQNRCYGAGLRFQLGPQWTSQAWKHVTGEDPGESTSAHYEARDVAHNKAMKRKGTTEYKEKRKKKRYL